MSLLNDWRNYAYEQEKSPEESQKFWATYFTIEQGIYEKLLAANGTPVSGTVKELAEKFETSVAVITGFLDGINDSLKVANPIEEMTEDTVVSLDYDPEKLYYNMVGCKADWLYELPQWDAILTAEKRKELYHAQKISGTVRVEKKVGRNEPCPCGSGKKYKFCCGR